MLWERLQWEIAPQQATQQVVVAYHALVADEATKSTAPILLDSRPRQELRGSRELAWTTGQPCAEITARLFGHWFTRLLGPWLMAVTEGAECEACWVTWFHLLIDFTLETGTRPPVYWAGGWQNPATGAGAGLFRWDRFARQVRHAVRHAGGNIETSEVRPDSSSIGVKTSCVWLNYPDSRLYRVEAWMAERLDRGACRRHDRSWRNLPFPSLLPL